MSLKLYNTITRKKEEFIPSEKNIVRIYVCGPTVYNYISIGNARPIIVFNMVRNYLKFLGYKVIFVQNITDIEDKIINKANAEGVDFKVITDRYIKAFLEDINTLEISSIDEMPLATKMIDEIIDIINRIIKNGYGYVVNGNVYFDVSKYKDYGKLSGQKIDEMKDTDENDFEKQDKVDFALWKEAKPGEPSWESPWGKGRPGWHIECSAMSIKHLGFGFDIHGGGLDLIFPHHENEIAQSEAAFPDKGNFVKYWMHNGMIEVKDRKMSKSDGLKEDWILKNLLKKYSPNIIKFYMLSTHYRSPLEFSIEKLGESKKAFEKIINTIRNITFIINNDENKKVSNITYEIKNKLEANKTKLKSFLTTVKEDFISAMNDDFNSAEAIGILFEAIKNLNGIMQSSDFVADNEIVSYLKSFYEEITDLYNIFGINLNKELKEDLMILQTENINLDVEEIENLIKERNEARKNKDFKKSDEIRNKLLNKGILLEDRKEGTIWKVQK
ncbi:MAG: cysteine--tRNA ligase [Actinobacteria bacterium]|nr:cysteine--tRNA ligase [Actinomycetota bacterium]